MKTYNVIDRRKGRLQPGEWREIPVAGFSTREAALEWIEQHPQPDPWRKRIVKVSK